MACRKRTEGRPTTAIAPTIHAFFTERLIGQRRASPHTIAAYQPADTLLAFLEQR